MRRLVQLMFVASSLCIASAEFAAAEYGYDNKPGCNLVKKVCPTVSNYKAIICQPTPTEHSNAWNKLMLLVDVPNKKIRKPLINAEQERIVFYWSDIHVNLDRIKMKFLVWDLELSRKDLTVNGTKLNLSNGSKIPIEGQCRLIPVREVLAPAFERLSQAQRQNKL